jgi:hypothetical protein
MGLLEFTLEFGLKLAPDGKHSANISVRSPLPAIVATAPIPALQNVVDPRGESRVIFY